MVRAQRPRGLQRIAPDPPPLTASGMLAGNSSTSKVAGTLQGPCLRWWSLVPPRGAVFLTLHVVETTGKAQTLTSVC